jgi:hypothetical protein
MWLDPDLILDSVSSLAVLCLLAWAYGLVGQKGPSRHLAPIALGLGFGLVAVLQMNAAFQPVPGLLVDLRLVPVALAGAYLGRRGLVACLVVVLAGRYQIGGIGAQTDLASILLAGTAGFAWDRATLRLGARGIGLIATLAVVTSAACLPALTLPPVLSSWLLAKVLPMQTLLHIISVLALAAWLERVRQIGVAERALSAAVARSETRGCPPAKPLWPQRLKGEALSYPGQPDLSGHGCSSEHHRMRRTGVP